MSHTPCVYYRLTRYRKDKKDRWQVIGVTSSDNASFFLEDDTGRIEIDPVGGRVRAGTRQEGFPGQVGLTRFDSDRTEKWQEEIIIEGTLLYVLGFAAVKQEEGESLREEVQNALRDLKHDPQRLKEFDLDGDGKICVDEWDAARAQMEEQVYHQRMIERSQQRRRQEDHIVIGRQPGRPLIIAETHSETHLTGKYRNTAIGLLLLSTILTGGAIYLLLNYWVLLE
jgi:Ca2+-binding EF-hand superfamily protein